MKRIVVLGWGNDARGDDALGPLLLRRISEWNLPGVETVEDYQLQIEHALDCVGADVVLFVDASRCLTRPFAFEETGPRPQRLLSTHALQPDAVLDVYAQVVAKPPPPAFTLALRGESFALGEGLSAQGAEALAAASAFAWALLTTPDLESWRAQALNRSQLKPEAANT